MSLLRPDFEALLMVLVVDDDPEQVDILIRFLSQNRMVLLPAYSGQQCLDLVRHNPIDVLILDVVMPGMGGLEVCAALKEEIASRSIAVIILTARDDMRTRLEGMKLGVSEFMVKPAKGQELVARIQAQVEMCRKIRELEPTVAHANENLKARE